MKSKGQQVDRSKSAGRSVADSWIYLFVENEKRRKSGEVVWTDTELTNKMLEFFPTRKHSSILYQVQRVRSRYNRGALTHGGLPEIKSLKHADQLIGKKGAIHGRQKSKKKSVQKGGKQKEQIQKGGKQKPGRLSDRASNRKKAEVVNQRDVDSPVQEEQQEKVN